MRLRSARSAPRGGAPCPDAARTELDGIACDHGTVFPIASEETGLDVRRAEQLARSELGYAGEGLPGTLSPKAMRVVADAIRAPFGTSPETCAQGIFDLGIGTGSAALSLFTAMGVPEVLGVEVSGCAARTASIALAHTAVRRGEILAGEAPRALERWRGRDFSRWALFTFCTGINEDTVLASLQFAGRFRTAVYVDRPRAIRKLSAQVPAAWRQNILPSKMVMSRSSGGETFQAIVFAPA